MLKNHSKKALLLSTDPADVSFLSELALLESWEIDVALNVAELCALIAQNESDDKLAAVFVDVSTPKLFQNFEFELQSKLGAAAALHLRSKIHFISEAPLSFHRELLQCPYFTFFSERKAFAFAESAALYQKALLPAHSFVGDRAWNVDELRKEVLSRGTSVEWFQAFRNALHDLTEAALLPKWSGSWKSGGALFLVQLQSAQIKKDGLHLEKFLAMGVNVLYSTSQVNLLFPSYSGVSEVKNAFHFFKGEV